MQYQTKQKWRTLLIDLNLNESDGVLLNTPFLYFFFTFFFTIYKKMSEIKK